MAIGSFTNVLRTYYDRLSDNSVLALAQAGDIRATEHLLYKYRNLVSTKGRAYFLIGGEKDDLLQVGMIGLWQSIMDYSPARDITFLSFARICIERHMITAIKTATRQKQSPLNSAVSIEYAAEEDCCEFNLSEILVSQTDLDPEEIVIRTEDFKRLRRSLQSLLSKFEWEVLRRYHLGKAYREIAAEMECNTKSIDNALGRIKRKLAATPVELFN